jgi:hypothetical protein
MLRSVLKRPRPLLKFTVYFYCQRGCGRVPAQDTGAKRVRARGESFLGGGVLGMQWLRTKGGVSFGEDRGVLGMQYLPTHYPVGRASKYLQSVGSGQGLHWWWQREGGV